MRLDKFLSDNCDQGHYSRKQLKQLIRQGEVRVNGEVVKQAQYQLDSERDRIELASEIVEAFRYRYFMLNKPQAIICDRGNSHYDDVFSLIDYQHQKYPLQVAGRLDQDTTGLVLLSNDGQWLHRASSGKLEKNKVYRVELTEPLSQAAIDALKSGVLLRGEDTPCQAKALTPVDTTRCELVIDEGRYHQVKRMFAAIGNKVVGLHRSQIGEIQLDSQLQPGESRALTAAEIDSI